MKKWSVTMMAVVGVAVIASQPVAAYSIHLKGKHHERLAWLSEECHRQMSLPVRCTNLPADAEAFTDISGETFRQGTMWQAVRWPDDPTRQLTSAATLAKFGLNAQWRCPGLVASQGFMAGLLCSSHHGPMQFLHAMRSSRDEDDTETRALIEGWSRFAFRVATGKISATDDYCATVQWQAGAAGERLAPAGMAYCHARHDNGRDWPAWRVGTLFSFRCDKMFSSATCDELPYATDDNLVRQAATGALLHLIEDSFSQAHATRGDPAQEGFEARIDCQPVGEFLFYGDNHQTHAQADKAPFFAPSCRENGSIIDPVTAGARLLFYVADAKANSADHEEAFIRMLLDEVIGPPAA